MINVPRINTRQKDMKRSASRCINLILLAALPLAAAAELADRNADRRAAQSLPSFTPGEPCGGQPLDAVVAENSFLPPSAIDSTQVPRIVLHAKAPDDRPLPCYRIGKSTYLLFGNIAQVDSENRGWNGNAGFIVTGDGVIVIDTLGTPKLGRRLLATIARVTDQPVRYVIITHNHPDHAYGAAAFQQLDGVTVIAHAGMLDYTNSATLQRSVDYRRNILGEDMQGFEPVDADVLVNGERFDRQRIQLGDQLLDIYNTGSHHSYGDLVIYQVNDGILWISDLAFNQRTTFMGDGDSGQILEAQAWLMQNFEDATLIVPGHGSPQSRPFPMVESTRRYVERLRETMRAAVENGVSLLDATENTDFEDWKAVPLYESNQRANAAFVYREMEEAYFNE
jgi:glyoxylase-like metal-dependent hydrolase (beta-lactamase superfamily II)